MTIQNRIGWVGRTLSFPRKGAANALVAVVLLACPVVAHAETCVQIDEARDGLSPAERSAALTLFEDALSDNHIAVARDNCTETWTIHHVRLGSDVTVTVHSPRGTRHETVRQIEDVPAMYSQIVKSLLTGAAISAESTAIDRRNVTDTQTVNNRVAADAIWYARLGYGGTVVDGYHGGASFGFGRRWEFDRFGIDLSFFNLTLYQSGNHFDGIGGSWIKLGGDYFFNPYSNYTPYLGAGLGFGTTRITPENSAEWSGGGLQGELSLGYELFRASTVRMFFETNASLPVYKLKRTVWDMNDTSRSEHTWAPTVTFLLGLGWGKPRESIVVTHR
ncbi:MAG TPA: hypothetical protein VFK05_16310 [Polyangiaceae bacterium]|nr:hypothetical protein [Polyangiaceae bacterium]